MNGNRFLLDTNAIVALFDGNKNISNLIIGADWVGTSIVTVIEFLSFPGLSINDKGLLNNFLKRIEVVGLIMDDVDLLLEVTQIRIAYKLKLPDAIIAATSIARYASLITADKGFDKVRQLAIIGL